MTPTISLLLVLAAQAAGTPDSNASIRAALQKQYDISAAAFMRRDVEGLMKMASPKMTSRRPNGQTWDRNQIQVYMNLAVGALKTVDKAKFKVKKVTVK